MSTDDTRYRTTVFLNAVVPLLGHVVSSSASLTKGFRARDAVIQVSALVPPSESSDGNDRIATHLVVADGQLSAKLGVHPSPTLELQFGSREALNKFFAGKPAVPRFRGALANPGLFLATMRSLLTMASLLGAKVPPQDPQAQALLTKCLFYLLTTGVSQLTKAGHPKFVRWAAHQPDRVYALRVKDRPDLGAFIRVKAGKTKAQRGEYTRSMPFFAMNFVDPSAALGILLETDDMIASTTAGRIDLAGAPEYGAELGELLLMVGSYAR